MQVTHESHPLTLLCEAAGLLDGQEGLASAGAAAYLHPVNEADGVKNDGLVSGEGVGGVLVGQRTGHDVALRNPLPLNTVPSWLIPFTVISGRSSS